MLGLQMVDPSALVMVLVEIHDSICSSYYTLSVAYCVYCTGPQALCALGSHAVKYAIRH